MTENTTAFADEAEGRDKRKLILAGGLVGALVLGGAGYLLLSGGTSAEEDYSLPVRKAAPKTVTAKQPAAVRKVTAAKLPAASSIRIGRDPFAAQYMVPKEAPATADKPATDTTAPTVTTGGAPAAGAPYVISLAKITSDRGGAKLFTFTIGKESKTVLPAQRFGNYGELVVLSYVMNAKKVPTAAVLQVGDDDPIEVPIGVKISVL